MEAVRVFSLNDWEASGTDGTSYAADDLKKCLEGLARHLFGKFELIKAPTILPVFALVMHWGLYWKCR